MALDQNTDSLVFHLAHDDNGQWLITPEGSSQRVASFDELRAIFAAALTQERDAVTTPTMARQEAS